MYIPPFNEENDPDTLLEFMQQHPFITLVSVLQGVPFATHLPVVTRREDDDLYLSGHLARANPQTESLRGDLLAIFSGPHAYISPAHYDTPKSVPTWNYVAVHAYGRAKPVTFKDDPEAMRRVLAELIGQSESSYQTQWDALPDKYRQGMMAGIVGFELRVTRLEGKYKLSQNRSPGEQATVARSLLAHSDPTVSDVGALMRERLRSGEG